MGLDKNRGEKNAGISIMRGELRDIEKVVDQSIILLVFIYILSSLLSSLNLNILCGFFLCKKKPMLTALIETAGAPL